RKDKVNMAKKKEIDLAAMSREEWDAYGKEELNAEPTRTWLNIGSWLNAGARFFSGKDSEKVLLNQAQQIITTLDPRTLRMYRETERATREARAENGFPFSLPFIFFYHTRTLQTPDQIRFLGAKRLWPNHSFFLH